MTDPRESSEGSRAPGERLSALPAVLLVLSIAGTTLLVFSMFLSHSCGEAFNAAFSRLINENFILFALLAYPAGAYLVVYVVVWIVRRLCLTAGGERSEAVDSGRGKLIAMAAVGAFLIPYCVILGYHALMRNRYASGDNGGSTGGLLILASVVLSFILLLVCWFRMPLTRGTRTHVFALLFTADLIGVILINLWTYLHFGGPFP